MNGQLCPYYSGILHRQHTNTTNFTILFFISIYLNNNYIEYQLLEYPGFVPSQD